MSTSLKTNPSVKWMMHHQPDQDMTLPWCLVLQFWKAHPCFISFYSLSHSFYMLSVLCSSRFTSVRGTSHAQKPSWQVSTRACLLLGWSREHSLSYSQIRYSEKLPLLNYIFPWFLWNYICLTFLLITFPVFNIRWWFLFFLDYLMCLLFGLFPYSLIKYHSLTPKLSLTTRSAFS